MKKVFVLFAAAFLCCTLSAQSRSRVFGDFNGDGKITIEDICHMINISIGKEEKKEIKSSGTIEIVDYDPFNGFDYVDLGLKDAQGCSILWATCNLGSDRPEFNGDYLGWGEIVGYPSNSVLDGIWWNTYKFYDDQENKITKYCIDDEVGIVDGKKTLETVDDAASQAWGGDWRMPTASEQQQLLDDCDWEWSPDKKGYYVFNKSDKNKFIFLPTENSGNSACYWSCTLGDESTSASCLGFFVGNEYIGDERRMYQDSRFLGHFIRPVISVK